MGFFSKLKQNFSHGGVKLSLQSPSSVSMGDASVPTTVTITATDTAQVIESISVEINASYTDKEGYGNQETIAQGQYNQPFTINPGESKVVQIAVPLSRLAPQDQIPEEVQPLANVLGALGNIAQAMDQRTYTYQVSASADIAGITFAPSDSNPIQILHPGQIGTAINFKL
jgi:sporulation-control protein spo0M